MSKPVAFKMAATALLLFLSVLLLMRLSAEEIDWKKCFDSICLDASCTHLPGHKRFEYTEFFRSAFITTTREDLKYLLLILPNLFTLWITRRPWLAATSFLLAVGPALSVIISQSPMHDCDDKGANGALHIAVVYLFLIAPISILLLIATITDRRKVPSNSG